MDSIHIDDFRRKPGLLECLAAVWSQGTACRWCYMTSCYRCGWSPDQVKADNLERCKGKAGILNRRIEDE